MKNLKLDSIQRYFDEETSQPLQLCFEAHELLVDGIIVRMEGVPLLQNIKTGDIHYPDKTKHLISYFVSRAKKDGHAEIFLSPKERRVRYSFAEEFNFKYSHIDYEYIPGLVRPWDEGFLTPVFFNLAVLNKYSQHPEYKLELFSETYGTIRKGDDWYISFGINRDKRVIMWLGDIDRLPDNEKYYLISENIESDHDIHSEFYDAQIEVQFSKPSAQTSAFHARKELNKLVFQKYGFDLYILEGEASEILENLDRPVFWQEKHVSPFIESLNRVFVESINSKGVKNHIKLLNTDADIKNKKGLKLFQTWLAVCLGAKKPEEIMLPFFVLYDFRIMSSHLLERNRKKDIQKSVSERLGLECRNNNHEEIYDRLIKGILDSYKSIIHLIDR